MKIREERQEPPSPAATLTAFLDGLRENGRRTPAAGLAADDENLAKLEELAQEIGDEVVMAAVKACRYPAAAFAAAESAGLFLVARRQAAERLDAELAGLRLQIACRQLIVGATGERWLVDSQGRVAQTPAGFKSISTDVLRQIQGGQICVIDDDASRLAA